MVGGIVGTGIFTVPAAIAGGAAGDALLYLAGALAVRGTVMLLLGIPVYVLVRAARERTGSVSG